VMSVGLIWLRGILRVVFVVGLRRGVIVGCMFHRLRKAEVYVAG